MNGLLRNLGWWVRDYTYAAAWQVRAFFDRADAESFRSGEGTPIVVLPGIYETWRFLQPLVTALHERGHPVHVVALLNRNERPVAELASAVETYLEAEHLTDVVLLAHSKGGLVGKQVMVGQSGERVRGMVAVATPFGGSRYARLMPAPTLRIFSPRDATIVALARELDVNERVTSVFASFDPHIPEGSELAGAKNVRLQTGGHFRILADPRVIAEVAAMSEADAAT
jgi:pimeloyl-ACP methyl ester carboxylesterase